MDDCYSEQLYLFFVVCHVPQEAKLIPLSIQPIHLKEWFVILFLRSKNMYSVCSGTFPSGNLISLSWRKDRRNCHLCYRIGSPEHNSRFAARFQPGCFVKISILKVYTFLDCPSHDLYHIWPPTFIIHVVSPHDGFRSPFHWVAWVTWLLEAWPMSVNVPLYPHLLVTKHG